MFGPLARLDEFAANIAEAGERAACGTCSACTSTDEGNKKHLHSFEVVSNSPIDGINFRYGEYTANQIAVGMFL